MQKRCLLISAAALIFLTVAAVSAQTTEFTYQGSLKDGVNPANGSFQMQFKLFDALSGGIQVGVTLNNVPATVTNGVFSVLLDFGTSSLTGANRWVEIAVRRNSGESYVLLSPREQITSSPYSVRTLSAAQADTALDSQKLGGVAASQFIQTNDPRLTDSRNPLPNSPSYIQNTTSPQAASNFNVSGDGTAGGTLSANIVNSTTQFNLDGNRLLSNPGIQNVFVGISTGQANTLGKFNNFFGFEAGKTNTTGISNSFFGAGAGAGNTTSNSNSFFGAAAGIVNTVGGANSFFGDRAGFNTTSGNFNSFFGQSTGLFNTTGSNNTLVGRAADVGSGNLSFASALGAGAIVTVSNQVQIGRITVDTVAIGALASASSTPVCINNFGVFASCSSSLRYKRNVQNFDQGLNLIERFRPVTFQWKGRDEQDIGLIAEEVGEIEPLLLLYNQKGEIEGVKYGQITVLLINAVKEQQELIQNQQVLNEEQQRKINILTKLICNAQPSAEVCQEKEQ